MTSINENGAVITSSPPLTLNGEEVVENKNHDLHLL